MKLLIKLFLFLLVLAAVLPLWLKDSSGRPLMVLDDWLKIPEQPGALLEAGRRWLNTLPDGGAESGSAAGELGKQQYYRWQGEDGIWHFSDEPPPAGTKAEVLDLPDLPEPAPISAARTTSGTAPVTTPETTTGTNTGNTPPMDSTIAPAVSLPEGVSREAIEQMLEATHQRRMGEEL